LAKVIGHMVIEQVRRWKRTWTGHEMISTNGNITKGSDLDKNKR